MQQGPRVAVIGLDCATPQLLFGDLASEVPNISKLMSEGMHGDLASITPPITVPAWACAMTGKTPGELGIYGFRNRKDTSYDGLSIVHSGSIKVPAVWDALGARREVVPLIGVPPSFPPPKEFPAGAWAASSLLRRPSTTRIRMSSKWRSRRSLGARASTSSTSRTSVSRGWSSCSIRSSR